MHLLPTFDNFSFFQASILLGVDKVLQKLIKSDNSELRHLFQCCILVPRKCPRKTLFQHTVPPPCSTGSYGSEGEPSFASCIKSLRRSILENSKLNECSWILSDWRRIFSFEITGSDICIFQICWINISGTKWVEKTPIYNFSTFGSKINEFERKKLEKNEKIPKV